MPSPSPEPSDVFEDVAPAEPDFAAPESAALEAPVLEEPVFEVAPEPAAPEPAAPEPAAPEPAAPTFDSIETAPEPPEGAIEPPQPAASEPTAPADDLDDTASSPATATLGELYLRQGHFEEAANIFRQVLAKDPVNTAARDGLDKIEAREAARKSMSAPGEATEETKAVTAEELLAQYASPASLRGLTAKKIVVLDSYLKHLRRNG